MKSFFPLFIAVLLGMAGCVANRVVETPVQLPKHQSTARDSSNVASDSDILLEYANYLRRLSASELTREHESLRQAVAKSKTDLTRAELAMFYALPGLPLRDDSKALAMLEPLSKEASSPSVRNFVWLLIGFVADNKRLDEAAQASNTKLKEEQRQSAELQQKLEALKSIEKSLSERGRGKQSAPK
ncbi:MAG: hypothetical protein V4568_15360 [Pseudomonadota bacterium]